MMSPLVSIRNKVWVWKISSFVLILFFNQVIHAEYLQLDCRNVEDESVKVSLNFDINKEDAEVQDPSGDIQPAKLKSFPSVLRFSYTSNPLMPTFTTIDVNRKDLSMVWVLSIPEIRDKFKDVRVDFQCSRSTIDTSDNLI